MASSGQACLRCFGQKTRPTSFAARQLRCTLCRSWSDGKTWVQVRKDDDDKYRVRCWACPDYAGEARTKHVSCVAIMNPRRVAEMQVRFSALTLCQLVCQQGLPRQNLTFA